MRFISYLFISLLIPIISQAASKVDHIPQTDKYSQQDLLKNWTLSTCLSHALGEKYRSQGAIDDAQETAAAYMEYSNVDVENYEKLIKLITKYMNFTYSGSTGASYQTMKCIDLYKSKELDSIVVDLVKHHSLPKAKNKH